MKAIKMAQRDVRNWADINATKATHASYFPFLEPCDRCGYACGVYGWRANLYRGRLSGLYYGVWDYGNEDAHLSRLAYKMGARELSVMENLARVEELEYSDNGEKSVLAFIAGDGSRFTVATFDNGSTWDICG